MIVDNLQLRKENHSSVLRLNIEDAITNLKKHVKSILSQELLHF